MRSYALLLASAASAYPVAPRRALRINALRAAPEVSEQQSWMIDYMAKAHTARLEAVQRAKAEAAAEMEARIKELEAQIAARPPPAAPAPAAGARPAGAAGPRHQPRRRRRRRPRPRSPRSPRRVLRSPSTRPTRGGAEAGRVAVGPGGARAPRRAASSPSPRRRRLRRPQRRRWTSTRRTRGAQPTPRRCRAAGARPSSTASENSCLHIEYIPSSDSLVPCRLCCWGDASRV